MVLTYANAVTGGREMSIRRNARRREITWKERQTFRMADSTTPEATRECAISLRVIYALIMPGNAERCSPVPGIPAETLHNDLQLNTICKTAAASFRVIGARRSVFSFRWSVSLLRRRRHLTATFTCLSTCFPFSLLICQVVEGLH